MEAIRIDSSQDVGIGTNAPDKLLHIFTSDAGAFSPHANTDDMIIENGSDAGMTLGTADGGSAGIGFESPSSTSGQNSITWNYNSGAERLRFIVDATETMTLKGANVGIGTTGPVSPLHITGAVGSIGQLTLGKNGQNGVIDVPESLYINIDTDNDETGRIFSVNKNGKGEGAGTFLFTVEESGKVGIGTSAPGDTLTVVGNISGSGNLQLGTNAQGRVVNGILIREDSSQLNNLWRNLQCP